MAIFLYYDEQGKLLELVNNDTVRLGNNNANTIYFYIDKEPNFTSKTIIFERSDGTKSNEYAITDNASLSLPYSKTRNYKYFKDFVEYDFSSFTVPSDILSVNGAYKATIRCIANDGTIFALGEFSFNVQTNVVKDDQNLTQSQYDYIWGLWGDLKNDIHTTIENTETALQDVQNAINSMNEQVDSALEDLKGQIQDSITELNNANVGGIRVNEDKELAIANKNGSDLENANSKVTLGRLLEVQSNTINVEECLDLGTLIPEGGKLAITNVGDYNLIAGTIDNIRYVFTKYGLVNNNIVYFNLSFKENKTYTTFIFIDNTEFVYTISTINLVDIDTLKLYQLDLSDEQMLAVNSGITSEKVARYDNYATSKQDTLVSGTNIKTFNGESILTSGNVVIPTTTNELTNNSGFITNAVNNLINYYLKSETYTKNEVKDLISGLSKLKILKVDELPPTGEENVIYLVPNNPTTRAVVNNCTEYIWQDGNYEVIGSTQVDLSNYPQLSDELVSDQVILGASTSSIKASGYTISNTYVNDPHVLLTGQAIAGELASFASTASLATVATTGSYNDLLDKPTIPTNTNQLTNGAGFITASALTPYATKTELGSKQDIISLKAGETIVTFSGNQIGSNLIVTDITIGD